VLSTFAFIKNGDEKWTIKLANLLLDDSEDLICKATGWMLREVGKNCGEEKLLDFLNKNYKKMPRVMLRYAIEKLDPTTRKIYLG
jgi:3-methyladenine DNA glycosylase AlkD